MPKTKIITLLSFLLLGASHAAFAGQGDAESIQVTPVAPAVGAHPEITGRIKCDFVKKLRGIQEIDVVAEVLEPDKTRRAWRWRNVTVEAGKVRAFTIPKDKYMIPMVGTYRVEFKVYTKDMQLQPVLRISKTFSAVDPPRQLASTSPQKTEINKSEKPPSVSANPSTQMPVNKSMQSSGRKAADNDPLTPTTRRTIGIGLFANTINLSVGPTFFYWPYRNIAFQGSFGAGTYTSYELRGLYRFNPSTKLRPYLGAGYLHAETEFKASVAGNNIEGKISGNSFSVLGGVEVSLVRDRLALYLDVSGTPLKLSNEITLNGNDVTIGADYSPVTIGTGLVYYLW